MKTRLLKSVRKRYKILKFDTPPHSTNSQYIHFIGLSKKYYPIYIVLDTKTGNYAIALSHDQALEQLIYLIRKEYVNFGSLFRHKSVVWPPQ